ncbi:hypothetical protein PsorP6_015896 [Peronosclerospora sorghi]|uniref:Uncharacterized protein n=1 Tax=Peronosclerospora sorghi TaxID=230839 RepID=A0ACC0WNX2_9STRA|nr:hypothetical protein PsorP6_015896 [Peronosclerospora sorghi]
MTRLGLSESMRSTASLENTESFSTAPRSQSACPQATETVPTVSKPCVDQTSKLRSSSNTKLIRVALVFLAFFTGTTALRNLVRAWWNNVWHVERHLDQLEQSLALHARDTAKLEATASRFLQQCQETRLAASKRSGTVQHAVRIQFDKQATTLMEEQAGAVMDMLQVYAQQKQTIQETKDQVVSANLSLVTEVNGIGDGSNDRNSGGEPSIAYMWLFYMFVGGLSTIYLWNAVFKKKRRRVKRTRWFWSPVPNALSELRKLLLSFVVIEDVKFPTNDEERRVRQKKVPLSVTLIRSTVDSRPSQTRRENGKNSYGTAGSDTREQGFVVMFSGKG